MVGRLLSFWDDIFSVAMLKFKWVVHCTSSLIRCWTPHRPEMIVHINLLKGKMRLDKWRSITRHPPKIDLQPKVRVIFQNISTSNPNRKHRQMSIVHVVLGSGSKKVKAANPQRLDEFDYPIDEFQCMPCHHPQEWTWEHSPGSSVHQALAMNAPKKKGKNIEKTGRETKTSFWAPKCNVFCCKPFTLGNQKSSVLSSHGQTKPVSSVKSLDIWGNDTPLRSIIEAETMRSCQSLFKISMLHGLILRFRT